MKITRGSLDWNPWGEREGLCADKYCEYPHEYKSKTLGWYWCTSEQQKREPYRSEQRRTWNNHEQ